MMTPQLVEFWRTTSGKEFVGKLVGVLEQSFPSEYQRKVASFLGHFCDEGKARMLSLLDEARKAGKLEEALQLLETDMNEHWGWRSPSIRGSFYTDKDREYLERAYQRLGLKIPSET